MHHIDKYYKRGNRYIRENRIEEGLTAFVAGIDRGCAKCAYGILYTVFELGSHTLSIDEAIGIFDDFYPTIKRLAIDGDAEAMVMVAQGIRYGFTDDEDEPYMLWLTRAASLGDTDAMFIIREIEMLEERIMLPPKPDTEGEPESTDMLLADGCTGILYVANGDTGATLLADHVLVSDADWLLLDELGMQDIPADGE